MNIGQFHEFYRNIKRYIFDRDIFAAKKIFSGQKNYFFFSFLMMWHWCVQSAAGIWAFIEATTWENQEDRLENTFENLTISEFHSAFIASTTKKLENLTNNPVIHSCQKLTHPTNYVYEPAECRTNFEKMSWFEYWKHTFLKVIRVRCKVLYQHCILLRYVGIVFWIQKNQRHSSNSQFHCFHYQLCAEESSLLKRPIFDGNSRNENAFFSMFSNSMT